MSILQSLVLIGFVLGIAGALKTKYDEEHTEGEQKVSETWSNIPQWSPGLKLMSSGVCMWLLGLILIGVTR